MIANPLPGAPVARAAPVWLDADLRPLDWKGPLYEYACHEGNYSLANALSGARVQEADAIAATAVAGAGPGR